MDKAGGCLPPAPPEDIFGQKMTGKQKRAGMIPARIRSRSLEASQLHPLVPPQVLHFMQVPLRTSV